MSVRLKGEHFQLVAGIGWFEQRRRLRKYSNQGNFLEQGEAEDLQHRIEFQFQPQALAHDGHQHINGAGGPNVCFDRVLRHSVESFDAQVLLDPFEEQLDLPAALVELRNSERG